MDVDRLSVYDCSACSPETVDRSSVLAMWERPVMSGQPKDVTIDAADYSILCLAQSRGTFCNYIKHGLDIGW